MKYSEIFNRRIGASNADEVFEYLIDNLKDTITKWDYFVNWGKVFGNIRNLEKELNILNYLIGKDNIEKEFSQLLSEYPQIIKTIPILIASRKKNFRILTEFGLNKFEYQEFCFKYKSDVDGINIEKVVKFANKTGFLDLLSDKKIKNVVDYVIGVEVGLDTNGRKNRTGTMMEGIVKFFINDICKRNGFECIEQASSRKVESKWGIQLTVDKSKRRIDFGKKGPFPSETI